MVPTPWQGRWQADALWASRNNVSPLHYYVNLRVLRSMLMFRVLISGLIKLFFVNLSLERHLIMQTINLINSNLHLVRLKFPTIRLRNIVLKEN